MLLVGLFAIGAHRDAFKPLVGFLTPHNISVAAMTPDPLATSQLQRSDNEMSAAKMQTARKGGMTMTRIELSSVTEVNESSSMDDSSASEKVANAGPAPPENATPDAAISMPTTEQVMGLKIAPILGKDVSSGQLKIGNFKPLSLAGNKDECLNVGYSMLGDTGSSNDLLDVITASDQITIAKICANNGSIIISCRGDQITVSPRRSRPDDKCQRTSQG